jgi:hypothetical protein
MPATGSSDRAQRRRSPNRVLKLESKVLALRNSVFVPSKKLKAATRGSASRPRVEV